MRAIRQPSLSSRQKNTGVALFISLVLLLLLTIIGVSGVRTPTLKAAGMAEALASASDEEREPIQAEIGRLRQRSASSARWVARLLIIAVAAMAVARYI